MVTIHANKVFIDYGIDWETAWKKHVQQWEPPEKPPYYVTVQQANSRKDPITPNLISGDLRETVDHPHIFLACIFYTDEEIDYGKDRYNKQVASLTSWKEWDDDRILENFGESGDRFEYPDPEIGYIDHAEYSHWPCSVLKDEGDRRYTVRIHQTPLTSHWIKETQWEKHKLPRILTEYRRESIRYFVKPEDQDHMLPNAFRHHVGIPDGIFPDHWMNLRN